MLLQQCDDAEHEQRLRDDQCAPSGDCTCVSRIAAIEWPR
jgi:hypothetical protein